MGFVRVGCSFITNPIIAAVFLDIQKGQQLERVEVRD